MHCAGSPQEPARGRRAHTRTPFVITGPPLYSIWFALAVVCSGSVLFTAAGACRAARLCAA